MDVSYKKKANLKSNPAEEKMASPFPLLLLHLDKDNYPGSCYFSSMFVVCSNNVCSKNIDVRIFIYS
jgi:hypothetical protein